MSTIWGSVQSHSFYVSTFTLSLQLYFKPISLINCNFHYDISSIFTALICGGFEYSIKPLNVTLTLLFTA